jgi:hypothetical protein
MKTRYKIIIAVAIVILPIFMILNPFDSGYFPFPWNNMNDTYCWSYFQAYHDEPIDSLALNLHIRNEIAKHGWEINVPWRGIEITSGAYSTEIMVTGSWHGVRQLIDGKETQIGINLIDDIAKFEGITDVKTGTQVCA